MRVTLNKNSWHYRLQKWTLDREPEFDNLCPYFWLTVLFMVISPFVLTAKLFIALIASGIKASAPIEVVTDETYRKRRAFLAGLAQKTKIVAFLLLIGAVGVIFALLGKAVYDNWAWWIVNGLDVFILVVNAFLGVGALIIVIGWLEDNSPTISKILAFLLMPILAFLELLYYYFKAIKDGYCPKIEWRE